MSKKLSITLGLSLLSITLIALLVFVIVGPFISLHGIKSNLESGKTENLEAYIDFPVLQKNIKNKIRKKAQAAMGFDFPEDESSENDNPLIQLAMQFANQIIDTAVEQAISPAGIAMILAGKDLNDLISKQQIENNKNSLANNNIADLYKNSEFRYISHQEFIFFIPAEDANTSKGGLVFTRKGIFWKLTDVVFIQKITV